jgi:hypothetical protein
MRDVCYRAGLQSESIKISFYLSIKITMERSVETDLTRLGYAIRGQRVFGKGGVPLGGLVGDAIDTGPVYYGSIDPALFSALKLIIEKDGIALYSGTDPDGLLYLSLRATVTDKSVPQLTKWRDKLCSPEIQEKMCRILESHKREIIPHYQEAAKVLLKDLENELSI